MFALIVGQREPREHIRAMALAMRGYSRQLRIHVDPQRGIAACAAPIGLLAEDPLDASPYVTDTHCFVGSGRVDNRVEVAEKLSLGGLRLARTSDVELLFLAYQRWGGDSGQHLAGQYSFCAVEHASGEVIGAVDHLGSVPLLYASMHGTHMVATQMGSMLAHPLLQRAEPDVDATALIIAGRLPRQFTSFRAIRSLKGGHTLSISRGPHVEERSWWNPLCHAPVRYSNPHEYVEHTKAVFGRAVHDRLRTSSKISATVSGGLDSSLVAGTAALLLRKDHRSIDLYTSAPELDVPCFHRTGWDNDESDLVRELAALHPNTTHSLVRPNGISPLDLIRETHELSHTPVRNTANQVYFRAMCHNAVLQGSRVLLTGERGNATISPAAEVAIGRLFTQRPLLAYTLARQDEKNGGRRAIRTIAAESKWRVRENLRRRAGPLHGEAFLAKPLLERIRPRFHDLGDLRSPENQVAFATLPATFFRRDETVHSGAELRDPTSDKRLIELLLALPPEAFFVGGRPRGLAREMGTGVVPESIRLRRRRGMQMPEHCGLIARAGDEYRDTLRSIHDSAACRDYLRLDLTAIDLDRLCRGELDLRAAATIDRILDVGLFWKEHGI